MREIGPSGAQASLIDRAIMAVSPRWAFHRLRYRTLCAFASSYRSATPDRNRRTPDTSGGSADEQATAPDLWSMREQSRGLDRDNVIAEGILNRGCENVVGAGFVPQATTEDATWNDLAEGLFNDWSDRECDIRGQADLNELSAMALRAVWNDGDVGFVLTGDGQLQAVEAEQVATPAEKASLEARRLGPRIVNGVDLDAQGRPLGYFVGVGASRMSQYLMKGQWDYVPARNFILMARPKRLNQVRGVPLFAGSLPLFGQLDDLISAEIVGSQVAAMLAVILNQEDAGVDMRGSTTLRTDGGGDAYRTEKFRTGTIIRGLPGDKATVISGNRPNPNFPPFIEQMLRFLGLAVGMPLEMVTLDFSHTNYSGARSALLQAYRAFRGWQNMITRQFLKRIWSWRVGMFIRDGKLRPMEGALRSRWIPPGWKWVDPLKEIQAKRQAVEGGLDTLTDCAAELGQDFEELMEKRARELVLAGRIAQANGLTRDDLVGWKDRKRDGAPRAAKGPEGADDDEEDANVTDEK